MSRTQAINDKCRDCIYDHKAPGTAREQISLCTSEHTCALWPYRPLTIAMINSNRKIKNDSSEGAANISDSMENE